MFLLEGSKIVAVQYNFDQIFLGINDATMWEWIRGLFILGLIVSAICFAIGYELVLIFRFLKRIIKKYF